MVACRDRLQALLMHTHRTRSKFADRSNLLKYRSTATRFAIFSPRFDVARSRGQAMRAPLCGH